MSRYYLLFGLNGEAFSCLSRPRCFFCGRSFAGFRADWLGQIKNPSLSVRRAFSSYNLAGALGIFSCGGFCHLAARSSGSDQEPRACLDSFCAFTLAGGERSGTPNFGLTKRWSRKSRRKHGKESSSGTWPWP